MGAGASGIGTTSIATTDGPARPACDHVDQRLGQHALRQHIRWAGDICRDGQQERPVIERGGVAAAIDEGSGPRVGGQLAGELAERRVRGAAGCVLTFYYLEAQAAQRRGDRVGGLEAGGKGWQIAIGAVADHQRLPRRCGVQRGRRQEGQADERGRQHDKACSDAHHGFQLAG